MRDRYSCDPDLQHELLQNVDSIVDSGYIMADELPSTSEDPADWLPAGKRKQRAEEAEIHSRDGGMCGALRM